MKTHSRTVTVESTQERVSFRLLKKSGQKLKKAGGFVLDLAENAEKVGAPAARLFGELQEAAFKGVLSTIGIVTRGVADTVRVITAHRKSEQALRTPTQPPPDDETREQWELEAAVSILLGEPVPEGRKPHLKTLDLSADSDELFKAIKARGCPLDRIYVNRYAEISSYRRTNLTDLSVVAGMDSLERLLLWGSKVS